MPTGLDLVAFAAAVYMLPWLIAAMRRHHNATSIFVLNLLLGWTFIGWGAALVWAFSASSPAVIVTREKDVGDGAADREQKVPKLEPRFVDEAHPAVVDRHVIVLRGTDDPTDTGERRIDYLLREAAIGDRLSVIFWSSEDETEYQIGFLHRGQEIGWAADTQQWIKRAMRARARISAEMHAFQRRQGGTDVTVLVQVLP